jgi:hypothetical protein
MNTLLVFLIILILLIAIAILVAESKVFKSPEALTTNKGLSIEKQQANLPSNINLPTPTWSKPTQYGNSGVNTCNIYTFVAGNYTPAIASYSKLNSGSRDYLIENIDPDFVCLDSDQIFAQTISHKCENTYGTSAGAGCILTVDTAPYKAGDFVPTGFIEGEDNPLYVPCVPTNINNNRSNTSYCLGNIGLVIPNFTTQSLPDTNQNKCLAGLWYEGMTTQGTYNTGLEDCNLSQSTQIFRTVRYSADASGNLKQDDKGPLASFIHRYTGYYLAPNLPLIPYTISGNTGFYYDFLNPIINYGLNTDDFGNKNYTSIDLVLINPAYDTNRNGVYWLLQNQTYDPAVNPQALNFSLYNNKGIYYNQSNFVNQFKSNSTTNSTNLPSTNSYFFEQTFKYCSDNPSALGCNGNPPSASINNDFTVSSCYFNTNTSGGTQIIENVPVGLSPQQIVYVPDINLLPDPNSSSIWTYLINNYSINTVNNSPILTPYRQNTKIDLKYGCIQDSRNSNNFFTILQSSSNNQQFIINESSDSQFINYNMFARQIQTGVSLNNQIINNNYKGVSNPFNY